MDEIMSRDDMDPLETTDVKSKMKKTLPPYSPQKGYLPVSVNSCV
jgi:hypothetical protein